VGSFFLFLGLCASGGGHLDRGRGIRSERGRGRRRDWNLMRCVAGGIERGDVRVWERRGWGRERG